ncbi:hypothetical protein ES703_93364 [subsurface metagenome]
MSLGDVHDLQFEGQFCGVPFSMGMAYLQVADDFPAENAGRRLIDLWFNTTIILGGPWHTIRLRLTDDLVFECASDSWDTNQVTLFLNDARGENTATSCPSPLCAQINIVPLIPHHLKDEGRFFLPGISAVDTLRSGFDPVLMTFLEDFCIALPEIDDQGGGLGGRYRLVPHAKYTNLAGDQEDIEAFRPFPTPFIKVLNSRRSDACTAFIGGGTGFDPIEVPPTPP